MKIGIWCLMLGICITFCSCQGKSTQNPSVQAYPNREDVLKWLKNKDAIVRGEAIMGLIEADAKEYAKDIVGFLKDENAGVRGIAVCALASFRAKECAKDIAGLLKDKNANTRYLAVIVLEILGAKEYADEIAKLLNDSSECEILDGTTDLVRQTTVSAEAERVLKEWGYDVEKLKIQNAK